MILFACLVLSEHDGDTFTCADRTRIRLAGVNAREIRGDPCPARRPCPVMSAVESRKVLAGMILGKTLACAPVGTSYKRVVATCTIGGRDLSCAVVAAGAAAAWPKYWARYRMAGCAGDAR